MQENKQEKSPIKQNILLYLEKKKVTPYEFYKMSGVTRGVLSQNNGISEENLARFLACYPEVNLDWLLTGKGKMLKESNLTEIMEETRPRIPYNALAGSLTSAIDGVTIDNCEKIPVIQVFPSYDFTIRITGNSMSPYYESGDEVACKKLDESRFIQWGRPHVLDTTQGVVIKKIYDNGEGIKCVSYNPDFPDFSVPKDEIYSISLVVGSFRL